MTDSAESYLVTDNSQAYIRDDKNVYNISYTCNNLTQQVHQKQIFVQKGFETPTKNEVDLQIIAKILISAGEMSRDRVWTTEHTSESICSHIISSLKTNRKSI